jgi:hypothetical protein
MPRETTLAKVDAEIAAGRLDCARDRLLGLLSTYPEDLDLRRRLGHVYWQLQDAAAAGKYWYLEAAVTAEQKEARTAFEQRFGGHPARILQALKTRTDPQSLTSEYSKTVVAELIRQAGPGYTRPRRTDSRAAAGTRSAVLQYGCMLFVAFVATFAIIGFLSILESFR